MKKILFFLSLSLVTEAGISQTISVRTNNDGFQNGWYNAIVKYTNNRSAVCTTYELSIKVDNAEVDTIVFDNGFVFHSGPNPEDYRWSGGLLQIGKDDKGNITGANTSVYLSDVYHNMIEYDIDIKQVQPIDNGQDAYNWLTQFNQGFERADFRRQSLHMNQNSE